MGATEKHMLPVTFATDNAVLHVSTPTVNVEQTSGLFAPVLEPVINFFAVFSAG